MTDEDFDKQFKKITDLWGTNKYGPERVKLIKKYCVVLESYEFEDIVRNFIIKKRSAPIPIEFMNASKQYKKTDIKFRVGNIDSQIVNCNICEDQGLIGTRKIDDNSLYAFRCQCIMGRTQAKEIPEWHKKFEPLYARLN